MKSVSLQRKNKGFSLIELIIVLGILGGLYLLVSSRSDTADTASNIKEEVENVNELAKTVRNYFGSAGVSGYSGLNNSVIYNSISRHMQGAGTNIRNAWSASGITVAPTSGNTQFTITSSSVPENACEMIAAQTYQSFISMTVNGTAITSPPVASTACSGSSNTLVWTSN